jgi:hypothetical protein
MELSLQGHTMEWAEGTPENRLKVLYACLEKTG